MTRTSMLVAVLGVVSGVALSATPAYAAPTDEPAVRRHASGLLVTTAPRTAPKATPEAVAAALHDAWERAEKNPELLGYPWADASGVVVDGVGATGARFAAQFRSTRAPAAAQRTRTVQRSFARLEALKHEIIGLTSADVPDGEAIWQTTPDGTGNRVVVTVERASDALLDGLAKRYGTDAIVVRVDPNRPKTATMADRNYDGSPFWGGTLINATGTCTSGFPWISDGTPMMLTAGHCSPTGGTVLTPVHAMGLVTPNSRENWTNGTGTVLLPGQGTYRGDLALIQIHAGKNVGTNIYRGPAGAGTSYGAPVREMWSRMAAYGDQLCIGGHVTGELCGWTVWEVRINHRYSNGSVVRNGNHAGKQGTCNVSGDSGGPVYTVRGDGGIAAKGIHSGGGNHSGGCFSIFTDIWDAYYGLPGNLKTL